MCARALLTGLDVNVSQLTGSQSEVVIAVNPTNPTALVALSNGGTADPTAEFVANSLTGGASWNLQVLGSGQDGIAPGNSDRFDGAVSYDRFGNVHVAYMARNLGAPGNPSTILHSISADNGDLDGYFHFGGGCCRQAMDRDRARCGHAGQRCGCDQLSRRFR